MGGCWKEHMGLATYGKQVSLYNSGATCIPNAIPIQNTCKTYSRYIAESLAGMSVAPRVGKIIYLGRCIRKGSYESVDLADAV